MKHKVIWLLAMVVILALSFQLPDAAAVLQERHLRVKHQRETLDRPALLTEKRTGGLEGLALQQNMYNGVEMETGKNMDAAAAQRAVLEAVQLWDLYGLLPFQIECLDTAGMECWPTLVADVEARTAIFWNASLWGYDKREYYLTLSLDDNSGQVVRFEFSVTDTADAAPEQMAAQTVEKLGFDGPDIAMDGGFDLSSMVDGLMSMLQKNYELQSVVLGDYMELEPEYLAGEGCPGYQVIFHVTGQDGYELDVPVRLWGSGTQVLHCVFNVWA